MFDMAKNGDDAPFARGLICELGVLGVQLLSKLGFELVFEL